MDEPRTCPKCSGSGVISEMVGCDLCDVWVHRECAGITDPMMNPDSTWMCDKCQAEYGKDPSNPGDHKSQSGKSGRTNNKSNAELKVKALSLARVTFHLKLKLLEEQYALRQRHLAEEAEARRLRMREEEEFLKKKHALMQTVIDEEVDVVSVRSKTSGQKGSDKVRKWLEQERIKNGQSSGEVDPTKAAASQNVPVSVATVSEHVTTPSAIIPTSTSTPVVAQAPSAVTVPQTTVTQSTGQQVGASYTGTAPIVQYPLFLPPLSSSFLPSNSAAAIAAFNRQGGAQMMYPGNVLSSMQYTVPGTNVPATSNSQPIVVPSGVGTAQNTTGLQPTVVPAVSSTSANVMPTQVSTQVPTQVQTHVLTQVPTQVPTQLSTQVPFQASAAANTIRNPLVGSPAQSHVGPTALQLAARHVIPKELPTFSGKPEEWPLFYSAYQNSTTSCGYSNAENLSRLQKCLKGQALMTVQSRLLMPDAVPHVIEALKMRYGNPEVLIHTLIDKVMSLPPPRIENLVTMIDFGLAVQNLVDHMIMAGMTNHLSNPKLLFDLVAKLPSTTKLDWAAYKVMFPIVDLGVFNEFMSWIVKSATSVSHPTSATSPEARHTKSDKKEKEKQKLYVHSDANEPWSAKVKSHTDTQKKSCTYCADPGHEIANCTQFKTLDAEGKWKAIRQKNLCKNCLIPHRKYPCRSGKECGVGGCRIRHHALLHSPEVKARTPVAPAATTSSDVAHQNHHSGCDEFSLFRYIPVTIKSNDKEFDTFAFLDDGSSSTLLEMGIASQLGVTGPSDALWLSWTGNISRQEKKSQRIAITIAGKGLKEEFKLNNVRTVSKLNLPSQTFRYEAMQDKFPHLRKLPVQSYTEAVPGIIIGIEHVRLLTALKTREGGDNDPVAVKTRLGWCVFGRQVGTDSAVERLQLHVDRSMDNWELHELMKRFFSVDEACITTKVESQVDQRAKDILQSTTRRSKGRFETGLLWKYDYPTFPNSFPMAVRRHEALEKRLAKDPQLKAKVTEKIASYVQKGYAHQISEAELESTDPNRVWYLPLGVVQNPKKPGKIRLTWDAAAKVFKVSFNDMILKGPDMLASLWAILLRFRLRDIAVCGDIEEMFHRIFIREEDKQFQRFLWRDEPSMPIQTFVMDVATFGSSCSPCSAQYCKNKNAEEYAANYPDAAKAIIEDHYVDDFLTSCETVDDAVKLVTDVKFVHSQAGFNIRNFSSNSAEVLQRLGAGSNNQDKSMNLEKPNETERVLGMVWVSAADVFTFALDLGGETKELLEQQELPTKRTVLRIVMSIFDPHGLLAHFVIHGKVLMQDIWRSGTNWDEPIPADLSDSWHRWSQLLSQLSNVRVPRCFFKGAGRETMNSTQIHVFVDASEVAYACCAYLRIVDGGTVRCTLVAAKTKVAPLKMLSIPRMELLAALLGAKLLHSICSALKMQFVARYLWSDSSTVHSWLRSDHRRYHQFVGLRLTETLSFTSCDEWFYVPSKLNVADEATKWGCGPNFEPGSRWYTGPEFLHQSPENWPQKQPWKSTQEELRSVFLHHSIATKPLIEFNRFSKWERLLRAMAYFQRAVKLFRKQMKRGPLQPLTTDELFDANNFVIQQIQKSAYPEEFCTLSYNKLHATEPARLLNKSSPLNDKSPYLDQHGVIRMWSRLHAAPSVPADTKYPVLLPKEHYGTHLLVDSYHRKLRHGNNETVVNQLRQRFSIPKLRPLIKKVAKECQHCKIYKARPNPPMMAPLPEVRLSPFVRPFTHTGLDYFGPLLVKQGRNLVKRWVALFTCLTVRAVHLEIVYSLSTKSCVMAIRRLISCRGAPENIYSDNGTCFVGASNQLRKELKAINTECAEVFTNAETRWHFIPPAAPHMGGAWERLVRSVKQAMRSIADHQHHPNDEVLITVLSEAQSIVNSRPLTYLPLDSAEQEALTPNHFLLYGTEGVNQPAKPLNTERCDMREGWNLAQGLVDLFWSRWIVEFRPTLTRRTKWFHPRKPLEPGDVVFVIEKGIRNGWRRGRIIQVFKTEKGQVRQAVVLTADGSITHRAAVDIAPLDVKPSKNDAADITSGTPELHGREDVGNTAGNST